MFNIDVSKADLDLRSKHFSRALTIIYSLQSSLDFEKGGEIAENLFQTYEFARQMIIGSIMDMDAVGPTRALALLANISANTSIKVGILFQHHISHPALLRLA